MYTLHITIQARKDKAYLKRNGEKATIKKIEKLLIELTEHPKTGTGHVEQLKGNRSGEYIIKPAISTFKCNKKSIKVVKFVED
jgi:toxin YoeB